MPKVSIKFVLSFFVIVAVVATALVAFLPLYLTGVNTVEADVDTIRAGIVERSHDNVRAFFKQGIDASIGVSRTTYHGLFDFDEQYYNKSDAALASFLYNTLADGEGTWNIVLVRSALWSMVVDPRNALFAGPGHTVVTQRNASFIDIDIYANLSNRDHVRMIPTVGLKFPVPRPTMNANEIAIMQGDQPAWASVAFGYDDIYLSAVAPIYRNGIAHGVFAVAVVPQEINSFLGRIGLRERGRAMVFQATGDGILIANNWNQRTSYILGPSVFGGFDGGLIELTNLTDPLINRVIDSYGLPLIVNGSVPFQSTLGDTEDDRTYVDIVDVSDQFGLNLRVVVAMPLIDFLGDFYESRTVVIIILVVAVVLIALAAVVFAVAFTKPLKRLGVRMSRTARLVDTTEDDKESVLLELAEMQDAYAKMKDELNRMKSFLPQTIFEVESDEETIGSSINTMNPLETFEPNSKVRKVASGSHTSVNFDLSGGQAVDFGKLRAAMNEFVAQDCSLVVVSVAYSTAMGTSEHGQAVSDFLAVLIKQAARHRGVVEQMKPHLIIVSFGGRRTIANSAISALKFALAITKTAPPDAEVSSILDRGTFFVGSCGSEEFRHETIHSQEMEALVSLAPLVHSMHRVTVAATGRIAPSLTERCVVFPLDACQADGLAPVQLFAVVGVSKSVADAVDKRIISQIKRSFGLMCSGNHRDALSELQKGAELVPGLDDAGGSATSVVTEVSNQTDMFYATVLRAMTTMMNTVKALGDSSQPYARRFLGWPTTEGPSPCFPVFDQARYSLITSNKGNQRLASQLGKLERMKEAQTPKFGVRKLSTDNPQASGLFEMAFALDPSIDDSQQESPSLSVTTASSATAPSAMVTFTDVPEQDFNLGPAAQQYLQHWRRGESSLGKGTFGAVYRALHDNGSIAAMKILPLAAATTDLDELRKELVVAAGQRHENLVAFIDADVGTEELVVIMELLPGGSLESLVKDFGQLPSRVVRRFVSDILRGLNHLHSSGIVHCDVKPQNILVGVDGVAKVADFGSALHPGFGTNFGEDVTSGDLKIPGTPAYMAPEVAKGAPPTPASDVWSFGVMLHELVTGRRPFNAKQLHQMSGGAFKCISVMGGIRAGGAAGSLAEPPVVALQEGTADAEAITSFLKSCLEVDPKLRPTCERLLTMEYLL